MGADSHNVVFYDAAGPDRFQQLVPTDHLLVVYDQVENYVEQPLGKLHAFAVEEKRAADGIQVVAPEQVGPCERSKTSI